MVGSEKGGKVACLVMHVTQGMIIKLRQELCFSSLYRRRLLGHWWTHCVLYY